MIFGIINTLLFSLVFLIIVGITLLVSSKISSANDISINRDGVVADLDNLGAMAQQYYRKPYVMGGGGESFTGWTIPTKTDTTPNGTYDATVFSQRVIIVGSGHEKYQGNLIQHTATVSPTTISIVKTY
jgi:hypothetical protein